MVHKLLLGSIFFIGFGCKQEIQGITLDKNSRQPLNKVAVSEHSFSNSYPYHYEESNTDGFFSITKEKRNSVLYFYKDGYKEVRLDFGFKIMWTKPDTIFLEKK